MDDSNAKCPWSHLFTVKYCNYSGYVTDSNIAFKLVKEYELATQSHFVTLCSAGAMKYDSNERAFYLKRRVHWDDPGHGVKGVKITYDGTPFIVAGTSKLECQYGPDRKKNTKAKKAEEALEKEPTKKRKCLISKKTNCPACIDLRKIYRYPDYKIDVDTQWKRLTMSDKLRKALRSTKCKEVPYDVRIYIQLPKYELHTNHILGEAGVISLPIDERVRHKIQQLAKDGIHNLTDMRQHVENFVKNELFLGQPAPSLINRRYYPKKVDYMNIRYRAEKSQKLIGTFSIKSRVGEGKDRVDGGAKNGVSQRGEITDESAVFKILEEIVESGDMEDNEGDVCDDGVGGMGEVCGSMERGVVVDAGSGGVTRGNNDLGEICDHNVVQRGMCDAEGSAQKTTHENPAGGDACKNYIASGQTLRGGACDMLQGRGLGHNNMEGMCDEVGGGRLGNTCDISVGMNMYDDRLTNGYTDRSHVNIGTNNADIVTDGSIVNLSNNRLEMMNGRLSNGLCDNSLALVCNDKLVMNTYSRPLMRDEDVAGMSNDKIERVCNNHVQTSGFTKAGPGQDNLMLNMFGLDMLQQEVMRVRGDCGEIIRGMMDAAFRSNDLHALCVLQHGLQETYKQFMDVVRKSGEHLGKV